MLLLDCDTVKPDENRSLSAEAFEQLMNDTADAVFLYVNGLSGRIDADAAIAEVTRLIEARLASHHDQPEVALAARALTEIVAARIRADAEQASSKRAD